jgi:outer membrane protein OmpA-like peptidoglycan-associated protein
MSLERARADYQQAANDPAVRTDASADLFAAEKLLQKAETSWQEDQDTDETDHLSYLTSRKVDLARATASQAASKRAFEELSGQKDQIRLKAREAEIERLKAKKVPHGILVTLGDVLFDTARSDLKPGSLQNIYPLVEYLKEYDETMVKIEGHTDSQGSSDYNAELSQRRAEAVRNFLVTNGIAPERITAQGMGEDYPVATNSSAAGRQQNRRVEVTITDAPKTMATPALPGRGM